MRETDTGGHIRPLRDDPAELARCADWRFEAFLESYGLSRADSLTQLEKIVRQPRRDELALVAVAGVELAGICLLVQEELDALHPVSPWLASLYVVHGSRRRGIGRMLVAAIEDHARSSGVARLHLYTDDAEAFYRHLGWTLSERCSAKGASFAFMSRDL